MGLYHILCVHLEFENTEFGAVFSKYRRESLQCNFGHIKFVHRIRGFSV